MADCRYCTALTVRRAHFSFRFAFSHHLASRRGADTLLIEAADSAGRAGFGQILPRDYLTGETLESAVRDVRERWWPAIRDLALPADADHAALSRALDPVFRDADGRRLNASYAGVDVALHSLIENGGRNAGGNNRRRGETRRRVPLVGVIDAGSAKKAARLARLLRWLGYRRFKVKVGTDAAADARRLDAVRRAAGPGAWLAADANAAWTWEEAVARMREMARWGVAAVEEPLARADAARADFRRLEALTGAQTMADESLCTLADARDLVARGSPGWWNVRAAKNGGITGAEAVAALARENGVRVYGGILVGETGALAAAGRRLLFSCGAECGEYGFSRIFLRGDPFRGGPAGYGGGYEGPGDWGALRPERRALDACGEVVAAMTRGK